MPKSIYVSKKKDELFTELFVDTMAANMWSYMNPDMIRLMFPEINTSYICGVNNDMFEEKHKKTICFKNMTYAERNHPELNTDECPADEDDRDGHYVYVDASGEGHSTYEKQLIYMGDDGPCHGAAMIYALNSMGYKKKGYANPLLISRLDETNSNTISHEEYRSNYRVLMEHYIWLIESGLWDKALHKKFYHSVAWIHGTTTCEQSQAALQCLKQFVSELELS